MALTKVTGSVIKDSVSLSGNVSVGGTLTYQDVTNVDALGIGTFRTGIKVLAGQVDVGSNIKLGNAGVITATSFSGVMSGTTGSFSGQVNVGSNIKLGTAGVVTATSFVGGLPITSGADNRVITASSASAIQGEANLVFNGTKLGVNQNSPHSELDVTSSVEDSTGALAAHGIRLAAIGATDEQVIPITAGFKSQQDRSRAGIGFISKISGSSEGYAGDIGFYTRSAADGSALVRTDERLRIDSVGSIGQGTATPRVPDGSNVDNPLNGDGTNGNPVFTIYGDSPAINLISSTTLSGDYSLINFGRAGGSSNPYRAVIGYKQSDDILRINANNVIAFDTGGNINTGERLRINSSGQLIVNSSSATDAQFTVVGSGHYVVTSAGRAHKHIHCRAVNGNSGEFGGAISFGMGSNGSSAIAAEQMGTDGNVNGLAFFTHPTSSGSDDSVKRMKINNTGGITLNNWGSNRGFIFERLDSGGASYPDFANVQGSNGRGMISSQKTINQNTTTDLCKSHWGGLALVGYSGSGHQGVRQVMFGYGGAGASVRFSGNWVGGLTTTFTVSAYTLRVSHNASNALDFWVILIGI